MWFNKNYEICSRTSLSSVYSFANIVDARRCWVSNSMLTVVNCSCSVDGLRRKQKNHGLRPNDSSIHGSRSFVRTSAQVSVCMPIGFSRVLVGGKISRDPDDGKHQVRRVHSDKYAIMLWLRGKPVSVASTWNAILLISTFAGSGRSLIA